MIFKIEKAGAFERGVTIHKTVRRHSS